jgi:3-oxoacyl-(acyl-carrier-protein) synthase
LLPIDIVGMSFLGPGVRNVQQLKMRLKTLQPMIGVQTDDPFLNLSGNIGGGLHNFDTKSALNFYEVPDELQNNSKFALSLQKMRKVLRRAPKSTQVTLVAALDAAVDSGFFERELPSHRHGVIVAGSGFLNTFQHTAAQCSAKNPVDLDPFFVPSVFESVAASAVSEVFGMTGPCFQVGSVCSSGNQALMVAQLFLEKGLLDRVMVVGAMHDYAPAEYQSLIKMGGIPKGVFTLAEAQHASRPFSKSRMGFVPAHLTSTLILERKNVSTPPPQVHGVLLGVGCSSDADAGLKANAACQELALKQLFEATNIDPRKVDMISAHATGTHMGDPTEAQMLHSFFREKSGTSLPPVTLPKALLGHGLGSSALAESVVALISLQEGVAYGTPNLSDPDDLSGVECVRESCSLDLRCVLNNSFGFGGVNACSLLATSTAAEHL